MNPNSIRVVAFSGGGGANPLSRLKGGRKVISERLEREFPVIRFMDKGANANVDLVLTPNCISKISNTKSRLTGGAPSMKISDFLVMMRKPWLIEELQIIPGSVIPRSPRNYRTSPSHSTRPQTRKYERAPEKKEIEERISSFWPRVLFYRNQDGATAFDLMPSARDFLNFLNRDPYDDNTISQLPDKNLFLNDVARFLKRNETSDKVVSVDTAVDSSGGSYYLIPLKVKRNHDLTDWKSSPHLDAQDYF